MLAGPGEMSSVPFGNGAGSAHLEIHTWKCSFAGRAADGEPSRARPGTGLAASPQVGAPHGMQGALSNE